MRFSLHPLTIMKIRLPLTIAVSTLALIAPGIADQPPAASEKKGADCDTGLNARSLLLQGKAVPTANPQAEATGEPRTEKPRARFAGRGVLIGPNGERHELSLGNPSGKNLRRAVKDGGAHFELKLAPDADAIENRLDGIEQSLKDSGLSRETIGTVLEALKDRDALGDVQVRGLFVGPDGERHEARWADEPGAKAGEIDRKMQDGGVQFELSATPNEALEQQLGLLAHAPETLRLLRQTLANPEAVELLHLVVSNPELMKFFENAAQDPAMLQGLQRVLDEPLVSGLLGQGLNSGGAAGLLRLFGGSSAEPDKKPDADAAPTPPAAEDKKADATPPARRPRPRRDREIDALRQELAEQRALLERLLERLDRE